MADMSNSKYLGKWRNASVTVFGKTEPMDKSMTYQCKSSYELVLDIY